jgi:hypothetical protein
MDGLVKFGRQGLLLDWMGLFDETVFFEQHILKVDFVLVNCLGLAFFKQVSDALFS